MSTAIEWTDATWNPTTGCDRVSPGCDHCYALTLAARLKGMGSPKYQNDGDPRTSGPGFGVTTHEATLAAPLGWREPRMVFVNSMSDLFHKDVPDNFIARAFAVMAATPRHTYQILTKRHGRMRALLSDPDGEFQGAVGEWRYEHGETDTTIPTLEIPSWGWPLPNVWLGVSVEDQKHADLRIPALLDTPAAVRFISAEPLLGPVDIERYLWLDGASTAGPFYDQVGRRRGGGGIGGQTLTSVPSRDLHWVIVGGESGPGARPMELDWARSLRDQCVSAGVPFHFKQWGGRTPKAGGRQLDGRTWDEFPAVAS